MEITTRTRLKAARLGFALAWWHSRGALRTACRLGFVGLALYPTLRSNCRWHGEVFRRFRTQRREVWLTIDDGPDARCTPGFLQLLERHGAKASFFVIGRRVDAFRSLSARIVAEGHTLENHTYSHPAASWWAVPPCLIASEIEAGSHAIRVATGKSPAYFRSPVGMCNPWVHAAAQRAGLPVVGWSASGGDGCPRAPSAVVADIMKDVAPGAILLLHAGDRPRHRLLTLEKLLERIAAEGYECVLPPAGSLY